MQQTNVATHGAHGTKMQASEANGRRNTYPHQFGGHSDLKIILRPGSTEAKRRGRGAYGLQRNWRRAVTVSTDGLRTGGTCRMLTAVLPGVRRTAAAVTAGGAHQRSRPPKAAAAAESAALLLPSRRAPPIAAPAPTGPLQRRIGSSGFAASLVGAQARLASTSAAATTSSTSLPPHSSLLRPPPFSRRFPLGVRACLPDAPRPHVLAHLLPTR